MTVNLTRIYTRLGDDGETHLGDMSRVAKTHPRVEAYGDVDELNALLGVVIADGAPEPVAGWLRRVQNDLFDLGADLAVPEPTPAASAGEGAGATGGSSEGEDAAPRERLRARPEQTAWLEARCDEVNAELAPLRSFVLPGGGPVAARLHVARTVCRRAERRTLLVRDANPEVLRYLNRLSDLLFILARHVSAGDEPLWTPGGER